MNRTYLALIILASLLTSGCGNSAGIEGKVVDGKGRPMSGIEVVARQKAAVRGHEPRETSTGRDGTFRFRHLLPASQYVVTPVSRKWKTSAEIDVQTAPKGHKIARVVSVTVRFTSSDDGVITDSASGLQWATRPGGSISWTDAAHYAETLSLDGGGWRLPTREELRGIYDESQEGHVDRSFGINRNWVWTSETKEATDAWFFNFENRYEDGHCREWVLTRGKVLVVRPTGGKTG
jgi:hypothetical protein